MNDGTVEIGSLHGPYKRLVLHGLPRDPGWCASACG